MSDDKEAVRKRFEEAFFNVLGDKFVLGGPSLQDLGEPEGLDAEKAFRSFLQMAEEGYVVARFFTGLMLYIGLGVERDREKGEKYLQMQGVYTGVTKQTFDQMRMSENLTEDEKWFWIRFWGMSSVTDHLYLRVRSGSTAERTL